MPDDPGGAVEFRSSLAFGRRLPRGHQVQGIIWKAAFFGASVSPCTLGDFIFMASEA